jgi:hypothetical protein
MYQILWFYGNYEGWGFHDEQFDTAEKALFYAMNDARAKFKIIQEVVFVGAKNTEQQVQADSPSTSNSLT